MMNDGKRVGSGIGAAVVDFNKTRYYFVSFCFVVVYSFEECVAGCGKKICSARDRRDFLAPGEKKVDLSLCLVFEPLSQCRLRKPESQLRSILCIPFS